MTRKDTKAPPRAWQRMLSGRRLDLLDPSPLDIEIADIAHGLARVARWNGQTLGPAIFSVAQHCVFVEAIAADLHPHLSRKGRLTVLLHDAPEYVIGDMISPFKAVLGDDYGRVELRLQEAVHRRFGLPARTAPLIHRIVKQADRQSAWHEAVRLAGFDTEEASALFGTPLPLSFAIDDFLAPWSADDASQRFLQRFACLCETGAQAEIHDASPQDRARATP